MKRSVRLGLRLAIVGFFVAAIANLPLPAGAAPRSRVYVLDASGSVGSMGARDALRAFEFDRRRLSPHDRAAFLAFGARPIPFDERLPEVERDATDLGATIEAALALAGESGEVVLATDGRDTAGGLDRALLLAAARAIPVHVMPVGPVGALDVRIAAVDVPAAVAPGSRFDARVTLESTGPARGTLNGVPFEFAAAARQVIVLRDLEAAPRLPIRLQIEDACPENNAVDIAVLVRPDSPRILTTPELAPALPRSWSVETGGRPDELDVVILDRRRDDVPRAVREQGVGLIVLGGSRAHAPGGFGGSELEEIMPLWAFPDERSTVVFVLDSSGSMNAELPGSHLKRIDAALSAVASSLALVHRDDQWALVAFAGAPQTVVPLRQGAVERPPVVSPGGPTRLAPALTHALAVADAGRSDKKRIVLVTDGETQETDAELERVGKQIAAAKARLTIFVTGDGGAKLARLGGILVPALDMKGLGDVMRDALARSHELTLENAPLQPREHALTSGLGAWPVARRLNRTSAKQTAQVLVTSGASPVLALGVAGRGRVAAATFALEEGWVGDLATWDGLPRLLERLIEEVSPPARGISSASARLEGDAIVFSLRSAGAGDELDAHPVKLLRRGADLYEGRVPARPGTTVLRVRGRAVAAFTLPHPREYAALGPDASSIERITRLTSGRVIERVQDLAALPPRRPAGRQPGRPIFLTAALVAFLIDLAMGIFWRAGRPNR